MLSVGDRITDDLEGEDQYGAKGGLRKGAHVLKEDLEDTTGLLVDEAGDTLYTTTTRKTTNSGLCDTWPDNDLIRYGTVTGQQIRTYLGCCPEESSCDAWRHPFRDPGNRNRGLILPHATSS